MYHGLIYIIKRISWFFPGRMSMGEEKKAEDQLATYRGTPGEGEGDVTFDICGKSEKFLHSKIYLEDGKVKAFANIE